MKTLLPTKAYVALGELAKRKGFTWWWDGSSKGDMHCNICDCPFGNQSIGEHGLIHIKEYKLEVYL